MALQNTLESGKGAVLVCGCLLMKRRAPRRTTHQESRHVPAANHCRALVPVDGAGIRKKIKKDYEKALRDLDNSRRQLDQFQQKDLPQFSRWLNTHFGELLTELRELGRKISIDEGLIFQVENEMLFRGGSYARAYQRVMEFLENPRPPDPNLAATTRRIRLRHFSTIFSAGKSRADSRANDRGETQASGPGPPLARRQRRRRRGSKNCIARSCAGCIRTASRK